MHLASFALTLLAAQSAYGALFPRSGPVKNLQAKEFKKELGDGHPAMVLFSAPWCGYCKQAAPHWSRAAETLSPLIPFYNVDCDEDVNKGFCASEGVKGYPTIKAYPKGSKAAGRVYQGPRETKDMIDHATGLVGGDKVKKIKKTEEIDTWLTERPEVPHVLLIHPSSHSVPLMWKVLANRLAGKMRFAFHRDTKGETKKAIGLDMGDEKVDQVRVILWNLKGEKEVYEAGPLKFEPLIKYFTHVLGETPVVVEETTSAVGTPTTQAKSAKKSAVKDAEARRREMEAKWQEEERRDRVRREKKEAERLARVFEDQERLAEGEFDDPSPVDSEAENVKVVHVAHGTPEDPVQAEIEKVLHELEAVAESAAAGAHAAGHVHADNQSPETPLQAASEDFEYGESPAGEGEEVDAGYSATTPLENEAEEVEEVSHAGDLHDEHARDEL